MADTRRGFFERLFEIGAAAKLAAAKPETSKVIAPAPVVQRTGGVTLRDAPGGLGGTFSVAIINPTARPTVAHIYGIHPRGRQ